MRNVERSVQSDQPSLAVLAAEARALRALVAELGRQLATLGRAEEAVPVDAWLAKATPRPDARPLAGGPRRAG
jgi:hypothetical protein